MRVVLDRSGPLWRIDLHAGRDFLYILGQERVWDYHPDQREYLENPLTHQRADHARDLANVWFTRGADRFRALSQLDARISFRQWEKLKNKTGEFRCAVLQVDPGDGANWKERLWIDPATALVWKLVADLPGGTTNIKWNKLQIGQPIDPALFVFTPPPGTVLRQKFTVYQGR